MAQGKWIDDLTAETPLREATRHVLALRLEVVHKELVRTLDCAGRGPGIRPPAARSHAPRDGGAGYLRRLPPEQGLPPGPEAVPADSTRRG